MLFGNIFPSIYLEFPLVHIGQVRGNPLASHPVQDKSHSILHFPSQQAAVDSEGQHLSMLNEPNSLLVYHWPQPLTLVARSSTTMSFFYRADQN